MEKLIVLGTGNASALRCYNTCFMLHDGEHPILVDAGGGNGIFTMVARAGMDLGQVRHAFLSHCHSDHLFGMIWVLRHITTLMQQQRYEGVFTLYGHQELMEAVATIARLTLAPSMSRFIGERIVLDALEDGDVRTLEGYPTTFFDIGSTKARQFGFATTLHNGRRLVFLGDEPCREPAFDLAREADWLLAESFCLYADRERCRPYEKHHSTVREACETAAMLKVRRLVLWHCEDSHLPDRKRLFLKEARTFFPGELYCPDDLDVLTL